MPVVKAIEARLGVADVKRSVAFYEDVLDFRVNSFWPDDDPQFAILDRDGLRLQLRKRGSPPSAAAGESWHALARRVERSGSACRHQGEGAYRVGAGGVLLSPSRVRLSRPGRSLVIVSEVTDDPVTCEEEEESGGS